MRGTLGTTPLRRHSAGIIPAYAGNTVVSVLLIPHLRDHPRVCGEHLSCISRCFIRVGSSPRMRGTPLSVVRHVRRRGIIPAYAGNTSVAHRNSPATGDHPRVCGEHSTGAARRQSLVGSSPRMRGTPSTCPEEYRLTGIIPAYAGNTNRVRRRPWRSRDHPRVCGEHADNSSMTFNSEGSSPRMRGTHRIHILGLPHFGIIPAYAGNTVA